MKDYILAGYHSSYDDIRFFKNQQWRVANYAILLYVAIVIASKNKWLDKVPVSPIIIALIALSAVLIIFSLEKAIERARKRKDNAEAEIKKEAPKYIPIMFGDDKALWIDVYPVQVALVLIVSFGGFLSIEIIGCSLEILSYIILAGCPFLYYVAYRLSIKKSGK